MTVKSGQALAGQFCVLSAARALVNADALPTGTLVIAGVNNGAVVTVANVSAGVYSWGVTCPALTPGQLVQVRGAATVGGVATGGVVFSDIADTSVGSDIAAALVMVQADLDDPDQYKADVSALATAASIASLPAAVWAYTTRTLTSFGTLVSDIWTWTTRTLTQAAAAIVAAVAGPDLAITRGDTYSQVVTGLGDISGRSKLWLTVKHSKNDDDDEAVIQIEETDGLLYLNGTEATAADGLLTVDDAVAGDVTIRLAASATAQLEPAPKLYYDWQMLTDPDTILTLSPATVSVSADVTRATE